MHSQTRNRKATFKRLTALAVAFAFTILGVLAPALHQHKNVGAATAISPAAHASVASVTGHSANIRHAASMSAVDDCPLCEWLSGSVAAIAPTFALLLIALSASAILTIAVRLAALCARPAPRRGLRAPPIFAHAA